MKSNEIDGISYSPYTAEWAEIEKLEKKGMGKSIIIKTDSILNKAFKENNVNQLFKALAYRSKYTNAIEEQSTLKILSLYEQQIKLVGFPLKQILHSATAELYDQYYQQNRWRFNQRSRIENFEENDIRSWNLDKILSTVRKHYLLSLKPKEDLRLFPTSKISPIVSLANEGKEALTEDQNPYALRPSLYDFLAHRALNYFKRNEGRVVKPIHEFNPDDFKVFSSTSAFNAIEFVSKDTLSNKRISAKLYQALTRAHQHDEDPSVLINIELDRLQHFYSLSNSERKDSLYFNGLQLLSQEHASHPATDEVDFKIAQFYFQQGSLYNPENADDHRKSHLKKAHEICKTKTEANSFGALECQRLLQTLESVELRFQTEDTYLPDQNLLFRLEYKNLRQVYFKLVKVPHYYKPLKNRLEFLNKLLSEVEYRSWNTALTEATDFRSHSTELNIAPLPQGNFFLIASTDSSFNPEESKIAYTNLEVSALSYFSRQSANGNQVEIYVRNRESGAPIANAEIAAFTSNYDYSSREQRTVKIGNYRSNEQGYYQFSTNKRRDGIRFSIYTEDDTLSSNSNYYLYARNEVKRKSIAVHLLTDRAIYRPGQLVYFKGIYIESDGNSKNARADYEDELSLFNANGEKVSSMLVHSNQYGSVHGSFSLPLSGLNGKYKIMSKYGSCYITVEEYKRPNFRIDLDSSKAQRRVNESIPVSGRITTFSGVHLNNSKVKYRVIRKASFPFWPSYRSFIPTSHDKEIANGVLETNENGQFQFQFIAQADPSLKSSWSPLYHYELHVEATNRQGETQALRHTIKLSNQAIYLTTSLKQHVQPQELEDLLIEAKNIDGVMIPAKVNLSLWKLKTPERAKKSKLWAKVDHAILDEKNYQELFPHYPTPDETSLHNFPKLHEVAHALVDANLRSNLLKGIETGAYELLLTTGDNQGNEISLKKRFIVYDQQSKKVPYPVFAWTHPFHDMIEVNDTAKILFASSLKDLSLLYEIEHEKKIIQKKWITINDEQRLFEIPITERYRGGISVHFTAVHSDRMVQFSHRIKVPFSNKKLKLKLSSYRKKTLPSSREKWTLSIMDKGNQPLAADVLLSMYDQSLDQFAQSPWNLDLYHQNYMQLKWDMNQSFIANSSRNLSHQRIERIPIPRHTYPKLRWFGFRLAQGISRYNKSMPMLAESMSVEMDFEAVSSALKREESSDRLEESAPSSKSKATSNAAFSPIRSDFRETAFFYPELRPNEAGEVSFEFKMPDALTQWKFRALAHTADLKVGKLEQSIVSQKELMVTPNTPRFFRAGDDLLFKAVINSLSSKRLSGHAKLRFYNASTGNSIDIFAENSADLAFEVKGKGSKLLSWKISIPENIDAIRYEIVAQTADFSDGEEKTIPVLNNRMMVTESLPLWVKGKQDKTFSFDKLLNADSLSNLTHEAFTLEFTPNPAWYAIQALPTIADEGSACSEHVFAQLFANSIAEKIATSHPKIKAVFDQWKLLDSDELTSKLMQNQELKNILIEETPWLQKAKTETEQKRRIALLFDYNRMAYEKQTAINKLAELQLPNGGWGWYNGMKDNRYISQYILNGFGHMAALGVNFQANPKLLPLIEKGIAYLDQSIAKDYQRLIDRKADLNQNHLGPIQIHYLYSRSFFKNIPLPSNFQAYKFYQSQAEKYWLEYGLMEQAMIALAVNRWNQSSALPHQIASSLSDRALFDEEQGMYWKNNGGGYYWHQSSVETQALLIELFQELDYSSQLIDGLKLWLLKQKQTQSWNNSKATALACYALLMNNATLLNTNHQLEIELGGEKVSFSKKEAGTAYAKKTWTREAVSKDLGNIRIVKNDEGMAWGSAYWQYYQDMDQITSSEQNGLTISKTLFKSFITDQGEMMRPIDGSDIKVGDKIKVRIKFESDRNLEFVHLKDMRASALEPIEVISGHKYTDGLGYYQSTKDASTHFFVDWVPKGVYIFEYELRVSQVGSFSNGISSIQCQYAPEFSSHSKGRRIKIMP